jgi:phosphoglycolate phosphatase
VATNTVTPEPPGRFLEGTQIEIINEDAPLGNLRCALFDFDGTISLIREGWQDVMVPMMVEILFDCPEHESEDELGAIVSEYVERLTGKQTIYQMIQLAEEIEKRGGTALDPVEYKRMYLERLWERIEGRVEALKSGSADTDDWIVPGLMGLLEGLAERDVTMYLASGTDHQYVQSESELLGVADYFEAGLRGAVDEYKKFSKALYIQYIFRTLKLKGNELVAWGDGYVEIENTKDVGGVAVGVASDEVRRCGINDWKRNRLIQAGADIIVPDHREHERLLQYLFVED